MDVGDPSLWAHPPFEGALVAGRVHGRGAVDIKGPFAAQAHAAAPAGRRRPRRDVLVASAVDEEVGGRGAVHLFASLPVPTPLGPFVPGACVVGEPSSNRVMLGHRGVARLTVEFRGCAHHASLARQPENPHFAAAAFLRRLERLELPDDPVLGASTIAPTLVRADTASANLTPNRVELTLDWRTTSESRERMIAVLAELAAGLPARFDVPAPWTDSGAGLNSPGFTVAPGHPLVRALLEVVRSVDPTSPEPGVWRFATDGRFAHARGIPTVGFGPGDEALAHTTAESIEVAALDLHVRALERLLLDRTPPA